MHRLFLLVLVALLASACAKAPRTVYADEATFESAGVAVAAWNDALRDVSGCEHIELALTTDRDEADIVVRMGAAPGDLYAAEHDGAIVVDRTDADRWPSLVVESIAHEIGHVLVNDDGWHSADKADLMYANRKVVDGVAYPRGPEPTAADVAKVCEAW